jgi:hypothetical protein
MTTQTLDTTAVPTAAPDRDSTLLGAGLGIASVVLSVTGFAIAAATEAELSSSPADVAAFYTGADLARTVAGGAIEILGLLLFLPFAAMLATRLRAPGPTGDVLSPAARMFAGVYVAGCLAPGMSAGATALWLAHSGTTDPAILTALNSLRSISYFIALAAWGLFLVSVGAGGRLTRRLPAWAAWSALGVGGALVLSVPVAGYGVTDLLGFVGLLWVLVVSVALLRRPTPAGTPVG